MCLNFYHKRRSQTSGIAYVKGDGIFECYYFGKMDQVCLGRIRPYLASMSCVKVFRSKVKVMSFHGFHWLQKLGSGNASFGAKVV